MENMELACVKTKDITKYNIIKKQSELLAKTKKYTYLTIKKTFDIIASLIAVIVLIPMTIAIKIAYLITGDTKSIFYSQKRIGKNGKEFNFYKFRSMVPNADEELKKILKKNKELAKEYRKNKKLKNDPRITRVGKIIRKTSIDEFPQFFNVLKGDMTIIGNRPYLPREKKDMGDYYDEIVKTKCGIVSYWAVMGRSSVSFQKRLQLETYYSNHQSLLLDIKIFLSAFKVVFLKKGAK